MDEKYLARNKFQYNYSTACQFKQDELWQHKLVEEKRICVIRRPKKKVESDIWNQSPIHVPWQLSYIYIFLNSVKLPISKIAIQKYNKMVDWNSS